jgi:DNA-binding response OmpR family regulator
VTVRPILIVEDDPAQCAILIESFRIDNGLAVSVAMSLREAEVLLGAEGARFGAVILDVGMPDGSGLDYCATLRLQGHRIPIIILTGSGNPADIVRALDVGANDYLTKPFHLDELEARLRAQLRIFEGCVATFGR